MKFAQLRQTVCIWNLKNGVSETYVCQNCWSWGTNSCAHKRPVPSRNHVIEGWRHCKIFRYIHLILVFTNRKFWFHWKAGNYHLTRSKLKTGQFEVCCKIYRVSASKPVVPNRGFSDPRGSETGFSGVWNAIFQGESLYVLGWTFLQTNRYLWKLAKCYYSKNKHYLA